ncbi:uncharacterized protein LOC111335916 isoform X2 [Stylophora pistillata]|nr:uncharacterized protein LOC111335916 isoform X2 [Stylophora pistillata]XP_022797666.1 uncharacterized protein LOC111335916 isoform X2 [Stylophora pistillata]XP_022797675.1 uncharacterized protein LOC111335916 isoform X2 [Stylophora pistillata]XP_022797682.1 uncharacterized protein LOC111335916 isoform X2 [Stylophora pistillata]
MKTPTMSSKPLENQSGMALPEYPKQWKSRLQRFQSSLRKSLRIKKEDSPRSASFITGEYRSDLWQDHPNGCVNFTAKHVSREILPAKKKQNGVSHKQLNAKKTSSHSHNVNGKTSFDSYSFDSRKVEQNKTNVNNSRKKKKNSAGSTSSPAANELVSELPSCGHERSYLHKKTFRSKRQRAKTNTEKTSLSKSKSLSILTNLFKRASHSKNENDRGKSLSFTAPQSSSSNHLSTDSNNTNFDTLVTDIVVSTSSIDSYCENDSRCKESKYYSLKRSKRSLVYPNNNISRSLSMDYSLQPCTEPLMEKSRTLAAIPPCIQVEEYHESRGCFERSLTVEFKPDSSGSVTIETGPAYYQSMKTSPHSCRETEVADSFSSGTPRSGVQFEKRRNITRDAERSCDAWKRRSAPPILSNSAHEDSLNIGSPIFFELKTDIATEEESSAQLECDSLRAQTIFVEERDLSSETVECTEFAASEMGNSLSFGVQELQKPRKYCSKDSKFKLSILRPQRKNGKTFNHKLDGDVDHFIQQPEYMECFERELERRNYLLSHGCLGNELTKDKSTPLCEGSEALALREKMIYAFHENNYSQDFSSVNSTTRVITDESLPEENQTAEENTICENSGSLPVDKINKEEIVYEENFCSPTFGQTEDNETSQQGVCLSCRKTRNEVTSTELTRYSPVCPDPSPSPANLKEEKLRDNTCTSSELITSGLRENFKGRQGLARSLKVKSLPCLPVGPSLHKQAMYNSFPDIRKLHILNLTQKFFSEYRRDSLSSCSLHLENSCENDSVVENSGFETKSSPWEDGEKNGGTVDRLSPESPQHRQRSYSTRIHHRSPVQQVLQTESRSVSCSQLDSNEDDDTISCTSPPYVRPRIQSLEQLPPCTAEVILKKKKSIMRKTRMKHTTSLSCVDNVFNDMIDKGKRHSYGGYGDDSFLKLPPMLHRSHCDESPLDSCNSSMQSLNSSSSFTENELGSSFSFASQLSLPIAFDQSLGRSRSVPGLLGADNLQPSPIPEEHSSVDWTYPSGENSDLEDDEMDVPEAFAEALWDHVTMDPEELSFQVGDIITVLTMTSCDWWFGQVGDRVGWFPAPFVRVRVSQTLAADETKLAPPVRTRKGTNEGFLSDNDVRSRVVQEILNTERDYVKNLEDVVEGYLKQARKRTDMFNEEQITKIFANIEQIYQFHQEILRQLEDCFVEGDPCASEIGAVFLNNRKGFDIYSEYCNNHPHAMAELKTLSESNKYKQFFEACRLLQEMIKISLDGFLLTPVQKICKYPLQLAELKKHTIATHKDFQTVKQALDTMKNVASLINERKRKVESINKIAKWQSTIEGWEGEDVLEKSSELIHSGDVIKTSNGSSQDRVMFLFDHQLVYCKKDILKKNGLTYKGRIDMDDCSVVWLNDGEETLDRSPLNNAWKIYNYKKEKWYIFYTKKAAQKEKWMKAFKDERRRVSEDAKTGLIISQNTRKAAMTAAKASVKQKKVNGKKEKPFLKSQSTTEIKPPPSPTLRLPDPVSSADLREEDEEGESFGNRTSVIRRSFGLRGSKRSKEKRMSSVY